MRYKILVLCIAIGSFLSSCNSGPEKARIKTRYNIRRDKIADSVAKFDTTYVSGGLTTTYIYNDTGALISQISSNGSKTVIVRTANMVVSTQTDSSGKVISKKTEILNAQGETDSSIDEKNGKVFSTHKFIYDQQGQKTEMKEYTLGGMRNQLRLDYTWKFNYKDGKQIAENLKFAVMVDTIAMVNPQTLKTDTIIQRMDKPEITTYSDYFTDKPNSTQVSGSSKNLVKRMVTVSTPKDTSGVNDFRYTFDDKGRVLTEVMESVPGYKDGTSTELEYDSTAYTYY